MKRLIAALILFCIWSILCAGAVQAGTVADTVWLRKATHINYDVGAWDTMFVDIMRGSVLVERVFLSSNGKGRWSGYWIPTYTGNFVADYNAVYGSDTTVEEDKITVGDTLDYLMIARIGTPTDPKNMATSLFAGQQYLADDCCGVGGGGGGCGAGAFACTVSVRDTVLGAGLDLVHVFLRNSDQAALLDGWTNADGRLIFYTDSLGTGLRHKLWLQKTGYGFDNPDSLDLRKDTTFTFYMTDDSVQCYVFASVYHPTLTSFAGVRVSARLFAPGDSMIYYDGRIISPFTVSTTTDSSGYWTLPLIPNADLKPATTGYIFNLRYPAGWGPFFTGVDQDTFTVPKEKSCQYDSLGGYP